MKVKNILVSQPQPVEAEKSPYTKMAQKHGLNIDYIKFIKIEGISGKEFRQSRVNLQDYNSIIFTSRQAVDHFFRISKELRFTVPETMKYFCLSESTAFYLQRYVQFRKRKIFIGQQTFGELLDVIKKHKDDKFLFPCSEIHKQDIPDMLDEAGIKYKKAVIYRTLAADLSHINIADYDMLVFFSPSGVKSLFNNFPEFEQNGHVIATFGATTAKAAKELGLDVQIEAPTKESPSMTMAIEEFIKDCRKKTK